VFDTQRSRTLAKDYEFATAWREGAFGTPEGLAGRTASGPGLARSARRVRAGADAVSVICGRPGHGASATYLLAPAEAERSDDGRGADRFHGMTVTVFKREAIAATVEEAVVHVGAEPAYCTRFVALGRVVQYNRC
jgi:hypothetical protein